MADITIGNSNLSQNHPRIITLVSNKSETFQTTTSGLTLFAAVISERGSEEITQVNSASEFLKLYGNVNIRNFGQSSYNVLNWLSSGAVALIKRVMPDNATYAHAYLNVRAKTVGDRVSIQPIVSSIGNATTADTIQYILENGGETNFEGFKDHLIASFRPIGRGKSYENMGFRLYTNKQFDNYVNFRVYNLEIIEIADDSSYEILEGPYSVSFYRDAMSPVNNESMFIEDVLNKYSEYLKVEVNDEEYLNICKLINPKCSNPYIVDPLFAYTRSVNGNPETIDGKDVHYKLFKLSDDDQTPLVDSEGNTIKFISNADNDFEVAKIGIEDEMARSDYAYESESKLSDMAEFLGILRNGTTVTLSQGMDTAITGSDDYNKVIKLSRKLLSRGTVADKNVANLKTSLNKFIKEVTEYKISLKRKEDGTVELNKFYDTLSSDLKLIANSHILLRIAFIQDKITSYSRLLSDLDITKPEQEISDLEQIVMDLSDEYTTIADKTSMAETLLEQDSTNEETLLYKINEINQIVAQTLTEAIKNKPVADSEMIGYYQDLASETATKDNFKDYELIYNRQKSAIASKRVLFDELLDLSAPIRFRDGSEGDFDLDNPSRTSNINRYLSQLFEGTLDPLITSSELCQYNFILDGNYDENVKNSIANLCQNVRRDFVYIADCGINANAKGDLAFRKSFNVSSNFIAIYGQSEVVYDTYGGSDVKVTTPYFIASKFPTLEGTVGLQNPIAGPKRGIISGFKTINYVPTEIEKEDLYNNRVNYIETDGNMYRLGSQLTSDMKRTPLSDLNNVITMLNIKRDAQNICKSYQFEFLDDDMMRQMQQSINLNLNEYVNNGAIASLETTVYASEYDLTQHIVRVNIVISFKSIIETVIITLEVQ